MVLTQRHDYKCIFLKTLSESELFVTISLKTCNCYTSSDTFETLLLILALNAIDSSVCLLLVWNILLYCTFLDVDECTHNPCAHGTCIDQVDGYKCNCEAGYTGSKCQTGEYTVDQLSPNINSFLKHTTHCTVG